MENNHVPAVNSALISLNTMRAAVSPEYLDKIVVRIEGCHARFGLFLIHEDGVITLNGTITTLTRAIVRLRCDQADFERSRPELIKNRAFDGSSFTFAGYTAQIYQDGTKYGFGVCLDGGENLALKMKYKGVKSAQFCAMAWIANELAK